MQEDGTAMLMTGLTLPHFHFQKLQFIAQRILSGGGRIMREVIEDEIEVEQLRTNSGHTQRVTLMSDEDDDDDDDEILAPKMNVGGNNTQGTYFKLHINLF